MFGSKNTTLKNPVSAIFKQLVITTFDFLDNMLRQYIDKQLKSHSSEIKKDLDIEEDKCELKPNTVETSEKKCNTKIDNNKDKEKNIELTNNEIEEEVVVIKENKEKGESVFTTKSQFDINPNSKIITDNKIEEKSKH